MTWIYAPYRDKYKIPCCSLDTKDRTPQKHLHYNLEILYMLRGNSIIGLYDGRIRLKEVPIDEGEFLIIGSGVIHDHTMKNGEMYLGWIPPQCIPSMLQLETGRTPGVVCHDTDGTIRNLLTRLWKLNEKAEMTPQCMAKCTVIGTAIVTLCYDEMCESMIEVGSEDADVNLMKYIFANYCNPNLNTGTLARMFGYATGALTKYLKEKTGKGVKRFIDDLRIKRAMALLVETEMTVEAVAISVGYECPRTFYRVFSAFAGITPKEYREKNRKNP